MSYRLLSEHVRTARKHHKCIWCGQEIVVGEKYIHEKSVYDHQMQNHSWHPECNSAADEYFALGEEEFTPYENDRPSKNEVAP